MHCVAERTRSRKALIDKQQVKQQSSSSNNSNGGDVVGLSYDDEDVFWGQTSGSGSESSDSYLVEGLDENDYDDEVRLVENSDGDVGRRRRKSNGKWRREMNIDMGEFGVRRRKVFGLDILISRNANEEGKCAAQRTRSHFRRSKKLMFGTLSRPICLDEEEDQDQEDHSVLFSLAREKRELEELWVEMECALKSSQCNSGDCWFEEGSGSVEEKHKDCKGEEGFEFAKKKHSHDVEDCEVVNVLQDLICGKEEVPLDSEPDPNVDLPPLRFTLQTKERKTVEKSEQEKELDELWIEMDYCLYGDQQNSVPASQVQSNTDSDHDQFPMDEVNTLTLCRQGKHHLILNEEIGLVCAYCLHVDLEIKYIVPPFCENPWGRSHRRDSCTLDHGNHSAFDELQHIAAGHDDYNLCNHSGTVWDIIPGLKKTMYPHQCEAFEFLWRNLAGGIFLDKLKGQKEFPGASGCIISHAPGTGKTRLAIVFLQAYMELYTTCRPMIIAPKGMLLTWEEEFKTWEVDIPFHNLNSSDYTGKESEIVMNIIGDCGRNISRPAAKLLCRKAKLYSWKCNKSILGISYTLFEQLTRSKNKDFRKVLLEHPGLLVLDEGHTPRNSGTLLLKAVSKIQTKRRIILSGTPFQNNFDELYNTLCLARPKFAVRNSSEGKVVFDDRWGLPKNQSKGKWVYLTNSFGKVIDDSRRFKILEEIRKMIHPFVHVHRGTILQESLPGLRKLVVILKPTQLQKEILEDIQKQRKSSLNVLKLEYLESVTAVHPALYDLSEGKKLNRNRLNPDDGVKTKFLIELIRVSELVKEKVLVFSEHIDPLKLVASQLKYHFGWTEGVEVLRIHGRVEAKLRQASMKAFNDPNSKVRVMLASIKACYEGISLVGASRVVLLDVVWNPSVEWQAICRAYRLGQRKFVYTYRLITVGTRDEEKCCRQAEKDQLSELVFFNSDGAQHCQNLSSAELEDRILENMVQQDKFGHIFEKVAVSY
ncbi:SNF2 domain-containing protein CLASSY 3-like [Abrus precatorius]|uniref:SNF2 domain-containing protein CLASSY 3-like n=1 Tax=Abrus precatorius TaxID=3816 RepID=A0A8B8M658_ABRPR|nr:SNF2 domain-containing protein CLASSY 3-like [Abrus precatorius]